MFRYFLAITLVCSIWACSTPKEKNLVIENSILIPNTPLTPLFDSLRPATQTYIVSGEKDTLIVSKEGTVLSFTKNTFVDKLGQPAHNVTISLTEVMSFVDIVQTNLQTISDDNILQTAGMFFIDAKENGEPLTIAEGKSIYVEVKAAFKVPDMGIFNGEFDKDGKINWSRKGGLENSLIPIPLNLLKFDGFSLSEEACYLMDTQIKFITNPKFENTFIATREFEERAYRLASCALEKPVLPDEKELVDIYTSNLDKPLFYSDSLVLQAFKKEYDKLDTVKSKKDWEYYRLNASYRAFKFFVKQHLTNVVNFEKIGVSSRTTVEELVAKGYSYIEAEKYVTLFKTRQQVLKDRKEFIKEFKKREEEAAKQRQETERITRSISKLSAYTFSISKLGWVNVDRFLNDERSQESTFVVQISGKDSKDSVEFITASLLIPGYGVVISSVSRHGSEYSFTNKGGNYRKLPVGETAIVFAFGYKAGKSYFGSKSITISKDGKVELNLNRMNERQIKKEIGQLVR